MGRATKITDMGEVEGAAQLEQEKPATRVYTLVRIFDKREYAEDFLAGKLRMRRLAYFRNYVDADGALRGDAHEGVAAVFQPAHLGTIRFGDREISPRDLTQPLLVYPEREQSTSVLCLWALTNAGLESATFENLDELKDAIALQKQAYGLGEHLVYFRKPDLFLERIAEAARKIDRGHSRRLVSYYDADTFHGWFPSETVPFQKRREYAHQREYRIVVYTRDDDPDPFILDVGDLSDIAELVLTAEFNDNLRIAAKVDERDA